MSYRDEYLDRTYADAREISLMTWNTLYVGATLYGLKVVHVWNSSSYGYCRTEDGTVWRA